MAAFRENATARLATWPIPENISRELSNMRSVFGALLIAIGGVWFLFSFFYAPFTMFVFFAGQCHWNTFAAFVGAVFTAIPGIGMLLATWAGMYVWDWSFLHSLCNYFLWVPLLSLGGVLRTSSATAGGLGKA
jgi:hypothetical protein